MNADARRSRIRGPSCIGDAVGPRLRLPCTALPYKGGLLHRSWVQASLDQTPVLPTCQPLGLASNGLLLSEPRGISFSKGHCYPNEPLAQGTREDLRSSSLEEQVLPKSPWQAKPGRDTQSVSPAADLRMEQTPRSSASHLRKSACVCGSQGRLRTRLFTCAVNPTGQLRD
jgi:hypothetical protein